MPGLLRGVARTAAIAGTATAVSNRVSRRQANRWGAQQDQQAYEAQASQQQAYAEPAPAPADDMDAKLAQLKQLGELKTQGVLSEAEFEDAEAPDPRDLISRLQSTAPALAGSVATQRSIQVEAVLHRAQAPDRRVTAEIGCRGFAIRQVSPADAVLIRFG